MDPAENPYASPAMAEVAADAPPDDVDKELAVAQAASELRGTRVWLLLSVLAFSIVSIAFAFFAVVILIQSVATDEAFALVGAAIFAVITLLTAGLTAMCMVVHRRIGRFVREGGFARFESAINSHNVLWRYVGVVTALFGGLVVVLMIVSVVGQIMMLQSLNF